MIYRSDKLVITISKPVVRAPGRGNKVNIMAFQITGIRKPGGADNTHEAISHYRWADDGKSESIITDRLTVVGWLDKGHQAYVSDGVYRVFCQVRQNDNGTRYLQTVTDNRFSNNLLSLPEC